MRVVPVLPPKEEQDVKEGLVTLLKHAEAVGAALDVTGFAHAWLSDYTRVVVAISDDGVTTLGFGILVYGTQFHAPDEPTASALMAKGFARKEILAYMKDCAVMLGARTFIYEHEEGDDLGGEPSAVRQLKIG